MDEKGLALVDCIGPGIHLKNLVNRRWMIIAHSRGCILISLSSFFIYTYQVTLVNEYETSLVDRSGFTM